MRDGVGDVGAGSGSSAARPGETPVDPWAAKPGAGSGSSAAGPGGAGASSAAGREAGSGSSAARFPPPPVFDATRPFYDASAYFEYVARLGYDRHGKLVPGLRDAEATMSADLMKAMTDPSMTRAEKVMHEWRYWVRRTVLLVSRLGDGTFRDHYIRETHRDPEGDIQALRNLLIGEGMKNMCLVKMAVLQRLVTAPLTPEEVPEEQLEDVRPPSVEKVKYVHVFGDSTTSLRNKSEWLKLGKTFKWHLANRSWHLGCGVETKIIDYTEEGAMMVGHSRAVRDCHR